MMTLWLECRRLAGAVRQAFACYLAFQCGLPLSSDKSNRNDLFNLFKGLLSEAKDPRCR
jgi:hypothetical protein